jgi:hypothetical protein
MRPDVPFCEALWCLGQFRLVLFPDSGHVPYADEPEAYFGTVARVLREACRR